MTLVRVLVTPVLIAWIVDKGASGAAEALWIALSLSDGIDGFLARRHGTTASGAFLDPLADKILVLGAMAALVHTDAFSLWPVLIIGGFSSIPGAIVGGLIVGTSEALADIYLGPLVSGSVSTWFAYVLALAFLLVRPAGLFGEKQIERV